MSVQGITVIVTLIFAGANCLEKKMATSSVEENKLSFISLAQQIESGLERGYPETEIIEAVIRAVGPGIALRSYLEATPGITLAKPGKFCDHISERTVLPNCFNNLPR